MRISDWSSDVCSSDLGSMIVNSSQGGGSKDTWVLQDEPTGTTTDFAAVAGWSPPELPGLRHGGEWTTQQLGRASCREKSVSVRLDLGGRRIIKTKQQLATRIIVNQRALYSQNH